jgi:hypothetical protein
MTTLPHSVTIELMFFSQLQSFILAQLTLSFLPLLLFASFVLSVLAFAAGCAIVFTLFWAGVALLFLIPTVLATGGLAILFWAWAVSSFLVAKWTWTMVPENWKGAVGLEGDVFGSQRVKGEHKAHNYVGRTDPAQNGNATVNQAHYEAAYGGQGVKEKLGLDGGVSLADIKAEVNEPAVAM